MNLPNRLPAAARVAARVRWPQGHLVRIGSAWAMVGRLNEGDGVRGWFAVLVAGYDSADGESSPRLWWTGASWGHKRRRDAVAAATAAVQEGR